MIENGTSKLPGCLSRPSSILEVAVPVLTSHHEHAGTQIFAPIPSLHFTSSAIIRVVSPYLPGSRCAERSAILGFGTSEGSWDGYGVVGSIQICDLVSMVVFDEVYSSSTRLLTGI